jgi:hypothetical protein
MTWSSGPCRDWPTLDEEEAEAERAEQRMADKPRTCAHAWGFWHVRECPTCAALGDPHAIDWPERIRAAADVAEAALVRGIAMDLRRIASDWPELLDDADAVGRALLGEDA